jgi:NAD(P)-dependent dehydrogenase (short-subunit alcohol dehydrogenase family)
MPETVLVTGAAGLIGAATVGALRAQGYSVVGLDVRPQPAGSEAQAWIEQDLRDTAATELVLRESSTLTGLQHVVAVAGGALEDEMGRLDPVDVPVDVFVASLQLNLVAQYALVRAGADRIGAETRDGDRSITLISSINAVRGYGMPGYSSAKAGLLGLAVSLALPLGRRGLRINTVLPGTVMTEQFRRGYAAAESLAPRLLGASASGRETRAEDVARAIVAVVGMQQMTGEQLVIDGGQLAAPFDRYPLS